MWRHQAVLSTTQRWLLRGHHPRASVGNHYHQFSTLRSFGGVVSFAATDELLLQKQSLLSASSLTRYGPRYGDIRSNNPLLYPTLISSQAFSSRRPRVPRMKDLHSVEEVILTAYEYLNVMSRRDISAVWARIALLMTKRQQRQQRKSSNVGDISFKDMERMLKPTFDHTTDGIEECGMKELTETTLGMAKIVKILRQQGGQQTRGG